MPSLKIEVVLMYPPSVYMLCYLVKKICKVKHYLGYSKIGESQSSEDSDSLPQLRDIADCGNET